MSVFRKIRLAMFFLGALAALLGWGSLLALGPSRPCLVTGTAGYLVMPGVVFIDSICKE